MAGLVKAKKYDWKDSNIALIGSDSDRKVKKESAQTEPAWKGAGEKVGLQIWRIVKFKVTHWPKDEYGTFFNGDSYIILNTYKKPETEGLLYDVHFWIGQSSSQDEYGTAAYKTLDDKPIQHREVMGYESDLFQTYFKSISILEGGADSGFRHVKPTEYKPRLLHFHGDKHGVKVVEKPLNKHCLDSSDVFILDMGLKLYQWNGKTGNKDERYKAAEYIQGIKQGRDGKPSVDVLDEDSTEKTHIFYTSLSDDPLETEEVIQVVHNSSDFTPCMFRLSDETGKLTLAKLDGPISKSKLDEKDVFIVDTGKQVFIWIGKETSADENKNAMAYAHNYLKDTDHPLVPVTCIKSGCNSDDAFNKAF
ncbi:hypothetical protein EMCRGX_G005093 [Ephydatia muelleri]